MFVWTVLACSGLDAATAPPEVVAPPPAPVAMSPRYFYLPGPSGVDTAQFSKWSPGDRLFVAVDGANLRDEPSTSGAVVTKLRLGEELEVLSATAEPSVLIGRRNLWYRIRTRVGTEGHLFGAILSPIRAATFTDAGLELVGVVSFSPAFGPRVRVWSPPDGDVHALDAEPPERYDAGGTVSARVRGSNIVVSQCAEGACDDVVFGFRGGELLQIDPPPPPE